MNYTFRNLVFEGGGIKGLAYGGALQSLDKLGFLGSIQRVAGTSAGAINAMTMALGCTPAKVAKYIAEKSFADFQDGSTLPANALRLLTRFGWYKGDAFMNWIGGIIKEETGTSEFTFGDLEALVVAGDSKYKYLYIVSSNLSLQKPEVFSHERPEYRDMKIREAVRMSMSLPVFFAAYRNGAHVMVDGGVSYNYPINLFDHTKYLHNPNNRFTPPGTTQTFNLETLGFRLDSKEVIHYAERDWATPPTEITSFKTYTSALLEFMMEMANKSHLKKEDWYRTVFIDTKDVRTADFNLPKMKQEELIDSGHEAVIRYFDWRSKTGEEPWKGYPVK